jgi:hypothetical protein
MKTFSFSFKNSIRLDDQKNYSCLFLETIEARKYINNNITSKDVANNYYVVKGIKNNVHFMKPINTLTLSNK